MVNISKVIVFVISFVMVAFLSIILSGANANEHVSEGSDGVRSSSVQAIKSNENSEITSLTGCEIKSVKEIMEFIVVLGVVSQSLKKLRISEHLDNQQQFSLSDLLCNGPKQVGEMAQE